MTLQHLSAAPQPLVSSPSVWRYRLADEQVTLNPLPGDDYSHGESPDEQEEVRCRGRMNWERFSAHTPERSARRCRI
jgi:hypothetical protein